MKKILKLLAPPIFYEIYLKFFQKYGWFGDYLSWSDAAKASTGYDDNLIINQVVRSTKMVLSGDCEFERDSVAFYTPEYSWAIVSCLLWVALKNKGKLNIIDFGGSLASVYFQNRIFFKDIDVSWNVIEQEKFVKIGRKLINNEDVSFYKDIDDCYKVNNHIDLVLFSGVLQYLENPTNIINSVIKKQVPHILIDRTPIIQQKNRITVQHVPPEIYKASYPCWFFNQDWFLKLFDSDYKKMFQFESLDSANIDSKFLGILFEKK